MPEEVETMDVGLRMMTRIANAASLYLLLFIMPPFGHLLADSIPPAGVGFSQISIGSSSNAVEKTLKDAVNGCWFMTTIDRRSNPPCTVWTSDIANGRITEISVYEIGTSSPADETPTASSRFTSSKDRDGNLRLKMLSTAWSSSDDFSYKFFFNVKGSVNTKFTLNYQLAEVDEVLVGSRDTPYMFDFKRTSAPKVQYGTLTNAILDAGTDAGRFYAVSELTAGERYYFGVVSNSTATTQLTVSDPDGGEIDLSSLKSFGLWDSFGTNVLEHVTFITNVEEHITIQTISTVVSNIAYSTTNTTSVTSVKTNDIGAVAVVTTNFVHVVTSVTNDIPSLTPLPTGVEITTNFEHLVSSIYTNRVYETNMSSVAAWKLVPEKSGRYVFRFDGKASAPIAMHNAVMSANSYDGALAFSEPDGTFIPYGGFLGVRVFTSPAQSSTRIFYTDDGSDPRVYGTEYESALKVTSPITVKAVVLLDDGDYGDVYSANYYLQRGAIAEDLGVSGIDAALDGTATNWYVDVEKTPKGLNAIRHVPIEDDEQVDLAMTLRGTGVFSFRWRTSSENVWDEGVFCTNGVEVARISGETAWEDGVVSVLLAGTNELTWTYSKNWEYSKGADCLWLADFEFNDTPDGSSDMPYRFEFVEATRLPDAIYGTITKTMTNGLCYMVSRLEANKRYYLGVANGLDGVELSAIIAPDGGMLPLGNLAEYDPWISGTTNAFDMSGLSDGSLAGICCKAWRFVPRADGDYVFAFAGEGEFTVHDAVMRELQDGADMAFSKDDGAMIENESYLKVKISCLRELSCTNIYFTEDGSDPRTSGKPYESALKLERATILKACLSYDDSTFGEVYSASYYHAASSEEIVGDLGFTATSATMGADVVGWYVDVERSPEGNNPIRNNAIGDDEEATLTLSLHGRGWFSFNWKVSSEKDFDEGVFSTNGIEVARISGEVDWLDEKIAIPVSGEVELTWKYFKDEEDNSGSDCLWLSDFAFEELVPISSGTKTIDVAMRWFDDYGLADVGTALLQLEVSQIDKLPEDIVAATNALPRTLYESYICGLNPTNATDVFRASIKMVGDVPVIEWSPNLGGDRKYEILGAPSPGESRWHSPTNSTDRFFKVKVSMPDEDCDEL